ncbi:MAG: hypothetical protein Alis3KO_10800 [Aliiglaciecola sp.]
MSVRKTDVVTRKSSSRISKRTNKKVVTASKVSAVQATDHRNFWSKIGIAGYEQLVLQGRRPDDLLLFELRVINLKVAPEQSPRLIPKDPNRESIIILELPAQHFGEQAFLDATGPEVVEGQGDTDFPDSGPNGKNVPVDYGEPTGNLPFAKMRMAQPSRLAFVMPEDVDSLPLDYSSVLLACKTWPMHLSSLALPVPGKFALAEKGWLKEAFSKQNSWATATQMAKQNMIHLASTRVTSAISASATRVAKQLVQNFSGKITQRSRQQINRIANTEFSLLKRRYSKLNYGDISELGETLFALILIEQVAVRSAELAAGIVEVIEGLKYVFNPHQPPASVTALELPYRLITSPLPGSHWRHLEQSLVHNNHIELWHTGLASSSLATTTNKTPIRAIWSPDYELDGIVAAANMDPPRPFRMSLDGPDREALVKLMAGYTEKQASENRYPPSYKPLPAQADRLILSSIGGLIDAEGSWDYRTLPAGVGLEQWRHLAAQGRDQYVRVVYSGYLYPFGHSASLIKVTERKFESYQNNLSKRVAVLRQRFFIVVREQVKTFNGTGHEFKGRNFPFSSIRINTRVTPNLRAPEQSAIEPADEYPDLFNDAQKPVPKRAAFWPMVSSSTDFEFELTGEDIAGKRSSFSMPLLFVGVEANQAKPVHVREAYNAASNSRRNTDFAGSAICYAPLPGNADIQGDPRLPTATMLFRGAEDSSATALDPHIYPEMENADISIRAVQRMLNDPTAKLNVYFPETYKQNGFPASPNGNNAGELFLEATTPFDMGFSEDKSKSDSLGAIASPSMGIAGLSRKIGPTGDPANVANNTFDPIAFFNDAKILGGISIAELISLTGGLDDAPKMLSREVGEKLEASFDWHTTITQKDSLDIFIHTPKPGLDTSFSMHGVVSAPIGQVNQITAASLATLENFKINLFGFITIWFDRLQFSTKTGSKPDVMVDLHPLSNNEGPVEFGGPLEFVNQLSDIIPMDGFSDPPNIAVSPSGLTASYSLAIPSVQVGIFALTNMSIGAGFSLPFNNEPMQVRFNFSERQNPFSLTVSLFGGGGFFALGIGTTGVEEIEASLEFGAAISIDLGVASGGVEVKGGVYFHWMQESVEISGYVRLHGELSIIGLISASLTFNLSLSYLKENGESVVWGEASLIIEVEVLVFSGSVTAHCRRQFAGSDSDPTFLDLMPAASDWAEYCNAFALEEAA